MARVAPSNGSVQMGAGRRRRDESGGHHSPGHGEAARSPASRAARGVCQNGGHGSPGSDRGAVNGSTDLAVPWADDFLWK